jgi:tetratricopeptide (TPR) repeat protein
MRIRSGLVAWSLVLAVAACGKKEQASAGAGAEGIAGAATPAPVAGPQVELGAAAQLDSGNAAYRAKDFKGALAHYRKSADRAPGLAAAWFGLYMAQSALGDKAGADSSMKKVQALAPGTMGAHPSAAEPGASGGAGGAGTVTGSGGTLPAGHPALPAKAR